MTIELRQALTKDLDLIVPLVCAYHEFEHIHCANSQRVTAIRTLLKNPDYGGIWLIYVKELLAGYIALCRGFSIEFNGFDAFIDEFFIMPEHRGKGVGARVLEHIKHEAKHLKVNAIHLEVNKENSQVINFYKQAGFEAREKYLLMSVSVNE